MDILKIIKEEMKRQHISESKMANKLGLSFQAVHNWFIGKSDPRYCHILDMLWVLNCEIELKKGNGNEH